MEIYCRHLFRTFHAAFPSFCLRFAFTFSYFAPFVLFINICPSSVYFQCNFLLSHSRRVLTGEWKGGKGEVPHSIQLSTMFRTKKEILNKLFEFWREGGGLNRLPQLSQSRDPMREIFPLCPLLSPLKGFAACPELIRRVK